MSTTDYVVQITNIEGNTLNGSESHLATEAGQVLRFENIEAARHRLSSKRREAQDAYPLHLDVTSGHNTLIVRHGDDVTVYSIIEIVSTILKEA